MNDRDHQAASPWKHRVPLALGVGFVGLLFVYLIIPGVVIGLLLRTGILDPEAEKDRAREVMMMVFCVPIFLAENVRPVQDFYEWQIHVVGGYR